MPRLYLVRHAIAEERDPARWPDDGLRPLSRRGGRRFIEAAPGLRTLGPAPTVSLSSPYTRAIETASLLEAHAGWPAAIEEPAFASGDRAAQIEALRGHDNVETVGVVGHEPDLARLASWLLSGDEATIAFEWRKGGLVILECSAFDERSARLVAHVPPRGLRR
jgi:phosphohistidine phosphatase